MIKNRIPITLNDERQRVTGPTVSYRYDAVQYLVISGVELPEAYAVDFCNLGDETTTPIVGGADGVRIPNKYLRTGKTIIAYLIITGDDEDAVETRYEITLPVRSRPKRGELDPTEEEREEIDILVDRLNEAVAEAEEQATSAAASAASASEDAGKAEAAVTHYPKIVDRYWYVWDAEHETWTNTGIKAEGVDGTDGVGIQSLEWNQDYTLTVTLTDGTVYTSISLRGEVGATPNLTIGTVTTGAAGSQASATIAGTPERPVLNLTIPRGDTGEVSQDDLAEALRPLNQAINVLDGQVNDSTTGLDAKAPAIINTASGAIASFADGADSMPVKQLVVSIEPVQEGTGDPSPDNIRPISGWTGAEIEGTGVNLLNAENSAPTSSARYLNLKGVALKKGKQYTISLTASNAIVNRVYVAFFDEPEIAQNHSISTPTSFSFTSTTSAVYTFTASTNDYLYLWMGDVVGDFTIISAQVELGSTATAYEPYQGSQISVTFPSTAGTVYGGTLTVNPDRTGALVVDRGYINLSECNWEKSESVGYYSSAKISSVVKRPSYYTNKIGMICDRYKEITSSEAYNDTATGIAIRSTNGNIWLRDNTYSTAEEVIASLTGQLVYPLATPITYTLTSDQISGILTTLYGTNNIWSDAGDVSVEYPCDTRLYIDNAITQAIAAALNA